MEDHDQRFKTLLREFFHELFLLFFPSWAESFEFAQAEWLDKEVFTDLVRGERRATDLVAKLPLRKGARPEKEGDWLALIHVEVEGRDSVAELRRRMYEYYRELCRQHNLPVLPVAIYLQVGLKGIGFGLYEESFLGHVFLRFEHAYVGLPALDGLQYLQGEHLLGVALSVLMKVPAERRAEVKLQALDRVVKSTENAVRKQLLCECIETYLPLEGPALQEYEQLLLTDRYQEVRAMAMTTYEKGLEKGLEKGREEGQRALLKEQLEVRFGPLSPSSLERLAALSAEDLRQLGKALMTAGSLKELGLADS